MKHLLPSLAGLGLCATAAAAHASSERASEVACDVRTVVPLAYGWRFKQDDMLQGAEAPNFDDADWAAVSVPHTWNRVGHYIPNPETHTNTPENINKTQGIGWYRLSFTPPPGFAGKKAWLQFDAASRTAEVWLNGVRLGEHRGGFSRFRLDATDALRPGQSNLLVVRTDNTQPAEGSSTADVLPLSGDFFVHGGLYRPVNLIATDPVHIDMQDFGGPGIYATITAIDADRAQIAVRSRLRNDATRHAPVQIVTRLIDQEGRVAVEEVGRTELESGAGTELSETLELVDPHLWQGTEDPYLYRLEVELRSPEGRVLDEVEQPFGVRQMRFDPKQGFFLNGKPLRLRGVGYHQDREGKGWAVAPSDTEEDVRLIREMGANSIRLTHYQHGEAIYRLADQHGLILWNEIPLVTLWTLGKGTEASPELVANARQQLQELIHQNYNHPSVVTWGIANEVDFGAILPYFLGGEEGTAAADPTPLLHELDALAKAEDSTRPTVLASCCEDDASGTGFEAPITAPAADLGAANLYLGWYAGKVEDLGLLLDTLHARRPWQPLSVSEYGAGGATTMHTDNVFGGPIESGGRVQPEEYESYIHEKSWAILRSKPYLWGTWLWNSFDFATTVRREGDANDINTKGLITYDRQIKKDAYFFYKANWSNTPTVHITGRRYVDRAYPVTDVRVYSNAPATELLVNGDSAGTITNCPDMICVWQDVRLAAGDIEVLARGRFEDNVVEDKVGWRLTQGNAHSVRIDSGTIFAAESMTSQFGSDNFFQGGQAGTASKPASRGRPAEPAQIANTDDDEIASTYRMGEFAYRVPLSDGAYTVTLTFIEPTLAAGERVFDVLADGRKVIRAFDVVEAAGAPLTAIKRSFPVSVRNGLLELQFQPNQGEAIVSAVEIEPAPGAQRSREPL